MTVQRPSALAEWRRRQNFSVRVMRPLSFAPMGGDPNVVLLSFRDVTEDRQNEEDLVRTRNFLQGLVDASVDAIVAKPVSRQSHGHLQSQFRRRVPNRNDDGERDRDGRCG